MRRIFGSINPSDGSSSSSGQTQLSTSSSFRSDLSSVATTVDEHIKQRGWFGVNRSNTLSNNSSGVHNSTSSPLPNPLDSTPHGHAITLSPSPWESIQEEELPFSTGGLAKSALLNSNGNFKGIIDDEEGLRREKDAITIDLLSSEARVDSSSFKVMNYDEMERVKKQQMIHAARIQAIQRSLAVESRLRDSAAKLVRLSSPSATPLRATPKSSSRPSVTKEQAESQLRVADAKLAKLERELHREGWTEAKLRSQLLEHTSAVLGLALQRREETSAGETPHELPDNISSPRYRVKKATNGVTKPTGLGSPMISPTLADLNRFEGHHFFSGNRDAITPTQRSGSPQLSSASPQSLNLNTTSSAHYQLELGELRTQLDATKREAAESLSALENEIADLQSQSLQDQVDLATAKSSLLNQQRQLSDKSHLKEGANTKPAVEKLQNELETIKEETERIARERQALDREVQRLEQDLEQSRNELEDVKLDTSKKSIELKAKVVDLTSSLSKVEVDRDDALRGVQLMKDQLDLHIRTGEEERERHQDALSRVIDQGRSRTGEMEMNARNEVNQLIDQKKKLVEAIGDVLRRHRTRSAMGSAMKDLRLFESDVVDRADLASYVGSTLDSYFDRMSAVVLDSTEAHRALLSTHHSLESTHKELVTRSMGNDTRLLILEGNEGQLIAAHEEINRLEIAMTLLRTQCTALGEEVCELRKQKESDAAIVKSSQTESHIYKEEIDKLKRDSATKVIEIDGFKTQIRSLEDRIEVSSRQEVDMLERLNEFTVQAETARSSKRKLESELASIQAEMAAELARQKSRTDDSSKIIALETKITDLEAEVEELNHTLNDLNEELNDSKSREKKQRARMTTELEEAQSEAGSLRTQLRAEQRKKVPPPISK